MLSVWLSPAFFILNRNSFSRNNRRLNSTGGPSGLTPQHLLEAISTHFRDALLDAPAQFMLLLTSGCLPTETLCGLLTHSPEAWWQSPAHYGWRCALTQCLQHGE